MSSSYRSRAIVTVLLSLAASVRAQDNPLGRKDAAQQPLPAWLKPGVRVSYLTGSASVPGETRVLTPDGKGDWVTPDGKRFSVAEARGTGSMGYNQYTIVAADEKAVAADLRTYLLIDARPDGRCMTGRSSSLVGTPDGVAEFWIPPAKLAAMEPADGPAVKVSRGKFPLNGKAYDVVTREVRSDKGYARLTFDLETGMLLAMTSSSSGDPTAVPGPDGVARRGAAWTTVGSVALVGVRTLDLPWANDAYAGWANRRRADYEGVFQTFVPGSPPFEQGASLSAAFGDAGKGWAPVKMTTRIAGLAGGPPIEQTADRAGSAVAVSPMWISPKTLAGLKAGQVIDQDPVTRFRATVAAADENAVVIVEEGQVDRTQSVYDAKTGALAVATVEQSQATGRTRMQLRLVERP
jgi:hypothetical protein